MNRKIDKVNHSTRHAVEVFETIHTVMHLFRARQYQSLRDAAHPLAHMEGKVLGFFSRHPGATLSELVAHSGRDKGQLARVIARLREDGYLDGEPDEQDRRVTRLRPSAQGKAVHEGLQRHARRLSDVAVAGLSDEDCQRLLALLEQVKANLTAD